MASLIDQLKASNDSQTARLYEQPCRFGEWLDAGGRALLFGDASDHPVDRLHSEVHRLGAELVTLRREGRLDEVQARIPELQGLNDQLLGLLNAL